jgi:threonine aldolase
LIDLRSDICAYPTDAMWDAMRSVRVGWATYGEDANVNELERRGAKLLGKEAAVLAPTCSMANLAALLAQTAPGDRVLVDPDQHIEANEGDWLRRIARLEVGEPAQVVVVENTHTRRGGTVLTAEQTAELAARAPRSHLDGARLANAAVALGVPLAELAAPVDTVALSLNKGLSAPFGALLAGGEQFVERAATVLHRLGGATVHRAGIAAAAGLVALETMVERLADDHRRARDLAARLACVPGLALRNDPVETNVVLMDATGTGVAGGRLVELLDAVGVRAMSFDPATLRFVTHRLIGDAEGEDAAAAVAAVVAGLR